MNIMNYVETNRGILTILLIALVLMVWFWILYRREKKKTERIIRSAEKEQQFYKVLSEEGTVCYAYFRRKDLKTEYVSPYFETLTGIPADEFYIDPEVVRPLFDRRVIRDFRKLLETWDEQEPLTTEAVCQMRGSDVKKAIHLMITADPHGYTVTIRDITEAYLARKQMQRRLDKALRASQEKSDFLSKMSHEIRTPMNGILGMLDLARVHIRDWKTTEAYLNKAENLSQFLLQLINDILDMSRIESGKMELEQKPFDLMKLGEKIDDMFRGTAEGKGINWEVVMQDFTVRYVVGDEMRLSQVIINFISNANKFTQAGGAVQVLFRQMDIIEGSLHFMVKVRDTGKGIREDFIDKIFRPFEQEDASTAHNYGGSGLGMAIADNIVRLMGGKILVESKEGEGSEFSVYLSLPVADEMEGTEQQSMAGAKGRMSNERRRAIDAFTLEGLHILFAEDNDINAEITMEILQMQGVSMDRAGNGREAVDLFKNSVPGTYDLILMDIQMPEMDGWEATEAIRRLNRKDADIPIFAMSANAFIEDQRHSMEVGMNGHINKPVNYDEMRKVIGEALIK